MHEMSGVLRPAVEAYLVGDPMSAKQIAAMRAYLRQWIEAPVWDGVNVEILRLSVDCIRSRGDVANWLALAESDGIDPL